MIPLFDKSRLKLLPIKERAHLLDLSIIRPLEKTPFIKPELESVAARIHGAKKNKRPVILMMGAHVIRAGVQKYIIDLIERGMIDCIAMNGAGLIHDFEFAFIGQTTESVAKYIQTGQFGLWEETGFINDIVKDGANKDMGAGEAVGKYILKKELPHSKISILAAAAACNCPVTAHVGIGYDIIHEHPNFDGAAWGKASHIDFLRFTFVLSRIQGGVVMNFGSAVMGPEVYLKALSMVRNIARQEGRSVNKFTVLVCDLVRLPDDYTKESSKETAGYYFRPWKTMLIRTVADGGQSFYVCGDHKETIPQLWTALDENRHQTKL
jgi:hypothetical protein